MASAKAPKIVLQSRERLCREWFLEKRREVLWATQRVGKIAQVRYGFGVGVGTFPGIFSLLIGAEPIWCVPSWPVLDEQALTNMPAGSNVNTTSDMVIFFFIFLTFLFVVMLGDISQFSRYEKARLDKLGIVRVHFELVPSWLPPYATLWKH